MTRSIGGKSRKKFICVCEKSRKFGDVVNLWNGTSRILAKSKVQERSVNISIEQEKSSFLRRVCKWKSFFYDLWHIAHLESPLTLVLCLTGVSYFRKLLTNLSTWRRDQQIQLSLWISLQFSCALLPTTKEKKNLIGRLWWCRDAKNREKSRVMTSVAINREFGEKISFNQKFKVAQSEKSPHPTDVIEILTTSKSLSVINFDFLLIFPIVFSFEKIVQKFSNAKSRN